MTITQVSTAEYDAFGPWISEVRTPEDVPRLYRGHPLDLTASHLVIKVPRNITRRDATPDMDLYDHLVALGAERLTVLSRAGNGYVAMDVPYAQVVAVVDRVSMLDGLLTVHTLTQGAVALPYNGSSKDVVARLVGLLRTLSAPGSGPQDGPYGPRSGVQDGPYAPRSDGEDGPPVSARDAVAYGPTDPTGVDAVPPAATMLAPRALGEAEVGLVVSYREVVLHEPGIRTLAAQGRLALTPRDTLARVLHRISPATLHGAVLCRDAHSLEVFGRGDFVIRGRAPVHSFSRTVVQLARVDAVEVREHERYPGVVEVVIGAGQALLVLTVAAGSPVEKALREVLVGELGGEPVAVPGGLRIERR